MRKAVLFALFASLANALDISCRDKNNNPVEWFIFYKIGRLTDPSITNPHILNGTGFLYMDANNKRWELPEDLGMESQGQAVGYTLQQYYDNSANPDITGLFYNDELPYPQDDWSYLSGHSKGFSVFGESNGFWLIHSIPKFPRNDTYEFPSNAHYYGQMGICVSLEFASLGDVAKQLYYIRPFISSWKVSNNAATRFPILANVSAGQYQQTEPFTRKVPFFGSNGNLFFHFAKCGDWGKDLYFDLLAPSLSTALKVETWQHETASNKNLHSWCKPPNPYVVYDAKDIRLPFGISFDNYMDHSKFAVATNLEGGPASPWVCIGDINRQDYQKERGGGSMCTADPDVYMAFKDIVSDYWECQPGYAKQFENF